MQHTNGKDHSPNSMTASGAPSPAANGAGRHRPRKKLLLASSKRDIIMEQIHKRGKDRVIDTLCKLVPTKNRIAHHSTVNDLIRQSDHSWSSTGISVLERLALHYQGEQQDLPVEAQPQRVVRQPPLAVPPQLDIAAIMQAMTSTMTSAMAPFLAALAQQRQLPAAQPGPLVEPNAADRNAEGDDVSPPLFERMHPVQQRRILNSMHTRYGDQLKAECGIVTGEHGSAWNLSYDAYDRETGAESQKRASAESDSTGIRIRPLDIIERDGDLIRFWRIVRRVWER